MLTIIVCIKQVYDPEMPLSLFQLTEDGKLIPPPGTPPVLSTFDENALEAALRIKDVQAAKITIISLGDKLAKPVLRKTLAAGADELILLEDAQFAELDSYGTAYVLAQAIERHGLPDMILCGRQAVDTDAGQVGIGLAERLQIPSVTLACQVEVNGERIVVERISGDGMETVALAKPALVTVSQEIGALRYPPVKALMAAKKMDITILSAADLGLAAMIPQRVHLQRMFVPQRNKSDCQMISDAGPEEIAQRLGEVLIRTLKA
ncbi:MAG: electron transfer flavoprotein subunit beta/FixA family protein [Peptococcaceae bacterium]|nr:electron transfer flavoprotein subunit beta/FixA family protein [Peptococcaceae bacterium]